MYTDIERMIVTRFKTAVPPLYYEQRAQFALSLPMLAVFSAVLIAILGGWLSFVVDIFRAVLASPISVGALIVSPFFWIELLPPILWAASYFPLRARRLRGWRLFVLATVLSLVGSLLTLNVIGILFSAAILYFTLLSYDEFNRR